MFDLFCGDSAELLKNIPSNSIDLTVTSPPYDNLRGYHGYSFNFNLIADELTRVLKKGGVIVWIVSDATINGSETGTSFKQALYFKDVCGLNLHDTMIWAKSKLPLNHNRYEQFFEYMFVLSKGRPSTFNGIRDKINKRAGEICHASFRDKDGTVKKTSSYKKLKVSDLGLRYNVWEIHPCKGKENRVGHMAPFPIQLATDHIRTWSNEGDTVLDPFMGSGTTGVAAIKLNRRFIGVDISNEYVNMSRSRLQAIECTDTPKNF